MGSGEREIGSKSSSLPQDPGDLAGLLVPLTPQGVGSGQDEQSR